MDFIYVDIKKVRKDISIFGPPQDDHTEYRRSGFNTFFHPKMEAPGLDEPSDRPYSFGRWRRFILRERIQRHSVVSQIISLSADQAQLLLDVAQWSIPSLRVREIFKKEFNELMPAFAALRFPTEGLFMRLDSCSARDGYRGHTPLHTAEDIVLRLVTSERVQRTLTKTLTAGVESLSYLDKASGVVKSFDVRRTGEETLQVYFVPFDDRISDQHKYRVFCLPSISAMVSRITAISQLDWSKPWVFRDKEESELRRLATDIAGKCEELRRKIVLNLDVGNEVDLCFLHQGFTFDVWYDEHDGNVNLIGLNAFGMRSGTGSCLFHWREDRGLLYGTNSALRPEFRATWYKYLQRTNGEAAGARTTSGL
ncbi:hypothetical protein F5Y04DRAFT_285132 [Hypomontagnella monticulosa]|nr:hypothetical protein F5Y04DRAFT_285132 [Hypomontagnella monticulosa]